ncbi:efflux RND transporter permease subunit [Naasia lichenicola]|uniref:Efflux RND transporter permease subunit n=1 Tax=Naasia lichenicola TaxID=2565933 RepID=A0A4S4FGZ1_9MICO|nr:efflux RND transporter permease subunit [Naasia lichenicola]THG29560.1 efflux RND transporter permease subunit [Naasia lichenicola]
MHLLAVASLKNRALIALVTIVAAVFGGLALSSLKQELIPSIQFPQIAIVTEYQGASPEVVNDSVSVPIEQAIQGVADLEGTSATSSPNRSVVSATFTYGVDLASVEGKVTQAINRIKSTLPDGLDPQVLSGSIDDFPVIQIAVSTDGDQDQLVSDLRTNVLPELEDLDGVRAASLTGSPGERVTITPNADELTARGLSTAAISQALAANGSLIPAGSITEDGKTFSVQAGTRLGSVDDIAALPLVSSGGAGAAAGGAAPTIGEVATVAIADDPTETISRVDGKPAVTIAVTKVPAANTVEVSHAVRDALPDVEDELGDATVTVVFDQAPFIERSIESLATEGLLGLAFAVLVILVFLLSVRATIVTAISIPTSVLITFVGMQFAGYSLNLLTLGGLTIAIGRVVDDSIVVIENIKRHLADDEDAGTARLAVVSRAVREVAGAVTASTVTTVAVFLPISFVGGSTGELFRPFALTVTIALTASLLVSLTIVPVLAYWLLKTGREKEEAATAAEIEDDAHRSPRVAIGQALVRERRTARVAVGQALLRERPLIAGRGRRRAETELPEPEAVGDQSGGRLQRGYRPILEATLLRPGITILVAVLVLGGTAALIPLMKTNFLGSSGQNTLTVTETFEAGTSLDVQDAAAQRVETALQDLDGIETVQVSIGTSGSALRDAFLGGGATQATYSITSDEGIDQDALQADVRTAVDDLDDAGDFSVQASAGFGGSSTIEIDVTAGSQSDLDSAAADVLTAVSDLDAVAEASSNLSPSQPYIQVGVDRPAAAAAGYSEVALATVVSQAMRPSTIGQITIDDRQYSIYLQAASSPLSRDELAALSIPTPTGAVRLDSLASVADVDGPASITTSDNQRSATISVTPASDNLGTANSAVQNAIDDLDLPAGASASLGGVTADQSEAFSQLGLALLAAILIVYTVMVATFRSLLQPLLLLISVPFAATGAILLQVVTGIPLGVPSLIGVLMLVGIVVTNAIVLVDLVNQYRVRGFSVPDAVRRGATQRLRPILMTALATIFALLPMAIGITGGGGFISQPLALVVIGGLLSSTVLTLIVLPVLYLLVEGSRERRRLRRAAR